MSISKLLSELADIVSESESRFDLSLSKQELPSLVWSQLGLVSGSEERIEVSNSFFKRRWWRLKID